MPDNQLAWLKMKQCHWIYLCSLAPLGKLSNQSFSFLDAGTSQLLAPLDDAADVGEVCLFLIRRRLVREAEVVLGRQCSVTTVVGWLLADTAHDTRHPTRCHSQQE